MPNEKLKKLYEVVGKDYNLPDYNTFEKGLQDTSKRRKFYDLVGQKYELPEYDKFNSSLFGEAVVATTQSQEIPTITLDQAQVEERKKYGPPMQSLDDFVGNEIDWLDYNSVKSKGPLKPGGGFTIGEQPKEAIKPDVNTGGGFTIGEVPKLTKQTKDVFVKNFLELPDNLKLDARNSGVFVNTFAKKMNLSPRELRQVANETVKTEVQLKQLKTIYDQNPDDTDTLQAR